jgi:uncharacterized protein (TIGR02270 family)
VRELHLSLYSEHIEDISFLYDQRNALIADSDVPWVNLQRFEERIEAHIDALVVGGQTALELCRARAAEGDAGELHAAVCVFCRCKASTLLEEVWRTLDFADAAKVRAVTEALKLELPQDWNKVCEQALTRAGEHMVPILSLVCASRRILVGEDLLIRMTVQPELVRPQTLWALGRIAAAGPVVPALVGFCDHAEPGIKESALLALLRIGERRDLRAFYLLAQVEDWPQMALGLSGNQAAATVLRQRTESGRATPNTLLSLGLLGDVTTVRALCQQLLDETLAPSAALALHWITGAPLYGEEFVADEMPTAELFDTELTAWRESGELPRRSDGKPFGHVVQKLACDSARWGDWLEMNAQRFDSRLRYRRGQPYSRTAVFHCLLDESAPGILRRLAYEELVIRFRCPIPFEVDWRVVDQRAALREVARWVATENDVDAVGGWR